jgi:hypothetical protein
LFMASHCDALRRLHDLGKEFIGKKFKGIHRTGSGTEQIDTC